MHQRFIAYFNTAMNLQKDDDLRAGQALMNTLSKWEPELYKSITLNNAIDPFYIDNNVGKFLDYVKEHMPEYHSVCSHSNYKHKCAACMKHVGRTANT